jgi:Domain of unknown function (DUF6542)
MVARSAPGFLLGLFIVAGTVAASLAVRPRAGRTIFPVPVLSYLVAALISGVVFDRSADSSKTVLAIGAAQWIANGFFTMAVATVLAIVIIAARWYLWRRGRPTTGDPGWPVPPADPTRTGSARTGPTRAGTVRPGTVQAGGTGRDGTARQPRAGWETAEPGYPASFPGPGRRRESGDATGPRAPAVPGGPGVPGGPAVPGGPGVWGNPGLLGTGPRPSPPPGAEPYNFSSGA